MLKQRHQLFVWLLALADATVIGIACLAAWAVRERALGGQDTIPWTGDWSGVRAAMVQTLMVVAIPVGLVCMRMFGLYRPWRDRRMMAEVKQVVHASLATVVSLIVLVWALGPKTLGVSDAMTNLVFQGRQLDAGRVHVGSLAAALPIALALSRVLFRSLLRQLRQHGWNLRHVAVVGTGRLGRIACRTLDRNSWTGISVQYFVDHHDGQSHAKEAIGRPVRGGLAQLAETLEQYPVDAVYLCLPNSRASLLPDLLRTLERFPLDVRIIPDVSPRYVPLSMAINELEGMPVLSVRESPMNGMPGMVKRAIDFIGALVGIILFGPLMAIIAAVIGFTSPGPVIFTQRRVSLGGEEFDIFKFRTMRHARDETNDGSGTGAWTRRNDPRITPIGRWLRRTSLDELPQLFNVLLGQMSLVGPRPERPELISKFREDWRGYVLRQHVKAGMTGWAQINGHRGDSSLRKRLQHDLFYIRHWSLGFDLKILWLTIFRGFVHDNAH